MSSFLSSLSFDTSQKKQADMLWAFISPCNILIPLIQPTCILNTKPHATSEFSNTTITTIGD